MRESKSKVVVAVILSSLLQSAALSAIAVVEVLFLTRSLGASFSLVGSILGPAAVAFLVFAPFIRLFAKRVGSSRFLIWSSLLLTCAAIGSALLTNPGLYLPAKILLALLGAMQTTVLLDVVEDEFRFNRDHGRVASGVVSAGLAGAAIGAFLSGELANLFGLSTGYLLAAGLFALVAALMFLLPNRPQWHVRQKLPDHPLQHLTEIMTSRYAILGGVVFCVQFFWATRDFVIPVFSDSLGHSVLFVGVLFSACSAAAIISYFFTRYLLTMNKPYPVLIMCLFVMTVSSFLLPIGGTTFLLIGLAGFGLGSGGFTAALADVISDNASREGAQEILTALASVGALAWLIAPLFVGIFLEAGVSERVILGSLALLLAYVFSAARKRMDTRGFLPPLQLTRKLKFDWS